MRTQSGIVGAGPAGLVPARALHRRGVRSAIIVSPAREAVEQAIRAGVPEQCRKGVPG